MAGSGVFPKIDGDVLYAYDVNQIAKTPQTFTGSNTPWITSGTALQNIGSIVFNSGTFGNPIKLNMLLNVGNYNQNNLNITISGIGGSATISLGSAVGGTSNNFNTSYIIHSDMVLGSPLSGLMFADAYQFGKINNSVDNNTKYASNNINNFNTGSSFIILFDANTGGSSCIFSTTIFAGPIY